MPGVLSGVRRRLLRYFLAGFFAIMPIALTAAIVVWVADFLNRLIGPGTAVGGYLRSLGYRLAPDSSIPYVLGCLLVLGAILLLGLALENGARRWVGEIMSRTIDRTPLVGSIYQTAVQLVSMLRSGDDERLKGMSVVMCRFGGHEGTRVLALAPSPDSVEMDGQAFRAVLIPTAPVPFGGALLFLPADAVQPAGVSLDTFISTYMSMGVSMPRTLPEGLTPTPAGSQAG